MANFLAALAALPKIVDALQRLGVLLKEQSLEKFLGDMTDVFEQMDKARTPEERIKAMRGLRDLFRRA